MFYMWFRWVHSLPDPCAAGAVVLKVMYDVDISVTSELLEDRVELFVTVEPTMTVFGVVLGLGIWAENNRHHINIPTIWYI